MAKSKRQKEMEQASADMSAVAERLKAIAGAAATEPYLTDAQSFLTQAGVCLGKQIVSEFGK